jgi:hypothetical protein
LTHRLNKEIFTDESKNIQNAIKQSKASLAFYEEGVSLCNEILSSVSKQDKEKLRQIEDRVCDLILVRTLGTMQSIRNLTIMGYYYEASILDRSFIEAIGLCCYLKLNKEDAKKWFKDNKIDKSSFKILESISILLNLDLKNQINELYGRLCDFVHTNSSAVATLIDFETAEQYLNQEGQKIKQVFIEIPSKYDKSKVDNIISYPLLVLLIMLTIFEKQISNTQRKKINRFLKKGVHPKI